MDPQQIATENPNVPAATRMVVEIIHTRGLGLYINGQRPTHGNWSIDEDGKGGYVFRDSRCWWPRSLDSDKGIQIGDYSVTGLRYDVNMNDFQQGTDPTEVTLFTDKGDITLPIAEIRNGYLALQAAEEGKSDEEVDELMTDRLTNGEKRVLDEFHTYVMAANYQAR